MKTTKELLDLIELKQINETTFEGVSISVGSPNVFGGQVLGQALNAAYRTVPEGRTCHSLHAYFILPGNLERPILYKVQLVRDGGSFTTRYVTAEQGNQSIFVLAGSFQKHEEGYDFQGKMPGVPDPSAVPSLSDIYDRMKHFLPENIKNYLGRERPATFKPTVLPNPFEKKDLPPKQNVWFRFNELQQGISMQHFHEILAYVSDYNLLPTTLYPHASQAHPGNTMIASLDHAMWFHRNPENHAGWFLYNIEIVSNANARGMVNGKIFSEDGKLIATVCQEGLIRRRIKNK